MRARTVITIVALAAAVAACGGSGGAATTGSSGPTPATAGAGATATGGSGATSTGPSGATAASGPTAATGGSGSTGSVPPTDLEDGRYFGYIHVLRPDGVMRFDLAYFYTGDQANRIAAERGDETPVPNDYYIVNDNPRLRTLALAAGAEIDVFDWNHCCDQTVSIDVSTFAKVIRAGQQGSDVGGAHYAGTGSQYWITLEGGVVTKVDEQFLP